MTDEKILLIMPRLNKHLLSRDVAIVNGYLKNVDEEHFMTLQSFNFKSPITGLILSWILGAFGGGAFYAKRTGFGIAQILFTVLYFFSAFLYIYQVGEEPSTLISALFPISLIAMWILYVISLICVWRWVKKYNFNKLMEILPSL